MSDKPAMQRARLASVRAEFAQWLATPEQVRRIYDQGVTEKEFADRHQTTTRTLRRWKEDPGFQAQLEELRAELDGTAPPKAERPKTQRERLAEEAGVDPNSGYAEYLEIKAALHREAMAGNPNALTQWMKTFGSLYLEAEQAAAESQFPGYDDDELVAKTLELVGVERVAAWLADQAVDQGVAA